MANTLQVQNSPQNYSLNPVVQRATPETDAEKARRLLGVSAVNQSDVEKARMLLSGGGEAEEQPGFFKSLGQSLIKPFAKVSATVGDIGLGTYLAGKQAITGNLSEKEKELAAGIGQPVQSKVFGEITPLKISKPLDVLGTGAELASYAIGAPAAKSAVQAGSRGLLKEAFKQGAYEAGAGALGGLGIGLQEEKPTVGGVLASTAMGGAGGLVLGTATPLVGAGIRKTGRLFMGAGKKALQDFNESVGKALKPRLGKAAETRTVEQYNSRALEAFQTMNNNKTEIVDELSGYVDLRNPKNLKETAEVLDTTEQKIFQEYDNAAQKAGEYAGFLPDNTVSKLKEIVENKSYPPNLRGYAEELIPQIEELRGVKFTDVQERVKILNQSLEDFYRGATTKAKAQIDASVASALRKELDDRILSLTGVAYQKLRNIYGSLAMVKKDVARQLALEIRRNAKGLYDMTDIFTGGDILIGALTGNPAGIIRGVSGMGIKKLYKYLNDPNRYIRKMFEAVEKLPKVAEEVPVKKPMLALPAKGQTSKSTIPLPAKGVLQNNKIDYIGKNNLYGAVGGIETYKDENGNTKIRYNPVKGAVGMGLMAGATSKFGKGLLKTAREKIKSGTDNLIQEAKKYKSAEEFVKAQGKPAFSGASDITKEWSNEKLGGFGTIHRGKNELGGGIYITDSPEYAKTFGSQLTESSLKPNLKLLDIRESAKAISSSELNKIKKGFDSYEYYIKNGGEELLPTDYPNEILDKIQSVYGGNSTDILKRAGFDGIIAEESRIGGQGGTVWNIFDAKNIKTKSQLTDIWNKANAKPEAGLLQQAKAKAIQPYKETGNLTTKILKDLEGKTTVSKQYILDATNRPELKQVERDLIREALKTESDTINVAKFAEKVKIELLPLKIKLQSMRVGTAGRTKYESITLPDEFRGNVANYSEHIWESPIKTSAGETHFSGASENYFGHTRIEDMAESGKLRETSMAGNMQQEIKVLRDADVSTQLEMAESYLTNMKEHFSKEEIKEYKSLFREDLANEDTANEIFNKVLQGERKTQLKTGGTRRVIEVQSDLYQKGGLERQVNSQNIGNAKYDLSNANWDEKLIPKMVKKYGMVKEDAPILDQYIKDLTPSDIGERGMKTLNALSDYLKNKAPSGLDKIKPLTQYNDPTAHFRMVREEVKQAAIDGKTKLQFPTGETAMKIEGLGERSNMWQIVDKYQQFVSSLTPDNLKIGKQIYDGSDNWIITDVLGDGKFKAISKKSLERYDIGSMSKLKEQTPQQYLNKIMKEDPEYIGRYTEEFDISGKVDTNNPIYKFYEKDLGRYLTSKYKAKVITDKQGVKWYEIDVKPEYKKMPVEAFGILPFAGFTGIGTLLENNKKE